MQKVNDLLQEVILLEESFEATRFNEIDQLFVKHVRDNLIELKNSCKALRREYTKLMEQ